MVLNFTVANLSIFNKWQLTTSHLVCTQKGEKSLGSEQQKGAVHLGF